MNIFCFLNNRGFKKEDRKESKETGRKEGREVSIAAQLSLFDNLGKDRRIILDN